MSEVFFKIGADGISQEAIAGDIKRIIQEKEEQGIYKNLTLDEEYDFLKINNEEDFIKYYLKIINQSWEIDVNDYQIPRKKGFKGFLEQSLKKIIWKLLKFYTYRLFSQQIEFNSQIRNALIAVYEDTRKSIDELEKRVEKLEKKQGTITN